MYYGKVEGAQILQLKAVGKCRLFFSLRRMALKPLPVLAAIRGKPPFENLKGWLEFSTFSPYLSPLMIL